jgi:glutamine cyclotransferase
MFVATWNPHFRPTFARGAWPIVAFAALGRMALVASPLTYSEERPPVIQAVKIGAFAHDTTAFSQGFAVVDSEMWEGTGQYGRSELRKIQLSTGRVTERVRLPKAYFGEGITLLNGKIYQLTWREGMCFVYDKTMLKRIGTFRYDGEGWGLANDGTHLYLSDGTARIRVIHPEKFQVVRQIIVHAGTDRSAAVTNLNELEFVERELWANVWYSDYIARISPTTGEVTGWLDASKLWPAEKRPSRENVLNGIAYDSVTKKLYLTGKNWPNVFEVAIPDR